jgi:DNA-binding response OmpR family regulator
MKQANLGKILIVDDEETMRRSLADILRLEGYNVQAASSGESAVESLRKDAFDLIILDLKMPGMDGLEVLRTASRIAPETMIILLTAHGSMESAVEALRNRAQDYILKPATPQQILNSVAKAMNRRAELTQRRAVLDQMVNPGSETRITEGKDPYQSVEPLLVPLTNDVVVDLSRREMWRGTPAGERNHIKLTPTEAKLLKVLLENRGQVMTHRDLVMMVQGYDVTDWEAPEVLRPLVSRLRQKLNNFKGGESWIVNVRGTGYVLERRRQDRGPTNGVERRQREV